MATQPITKSEAQRTVRAIEDALRKGHRPMGMGGKGPAALSIAAVALGVHPSTMNNRVATIEREYGLAPDWAIWKPSAVGAIASPEAAKVRRLEGDLTATRAQLKAATKALDAEDMVRQEIFRLAAQPVTPPSWLVRPSKRSGSEMPILFGSDYQWGEVIQASNVGGVNEFNPAIARARLRKLVEKTCHLLLDIHKGAHYDGFVYLRGGDLISGEIHDELAQTNALQAIPAVVDLVQMDTWVIRTLAAKFGRVHVITVPGNHGRTTRKPHAKKYAEHNYDTLTAWMLESKFEGDKRISFQTPLSGDAVFEIYGWRYLLSHGDRMGSSGGQGFVGPAATIMRGHKKLAMEFSELNQPLHCIFTGHHHTSLRLEMGFANGSLPGLSEYARNLRVTPKPPSQWLFTAHPDRPIAQMWEIELEKRPRLEAPANDLAETMRRKAA